MNNIDSQDQHEYGEYDSHESFTNPEGELKVLLIIVGH